MSAIHGRDAGDLKKYRTEIPNIVFTLGLDAYSLSLYCHLKRTTGAAEGGLCYKSTRTLAEETGMSAGKVSEARSELEQPRRELGGKPLIHIERPKDKSKAVEVICMDVWAENFEYFGPRGSIVPSVHHTNTSVQETNTECSPHEPKKEPQKKEPQKNSPRGLAPEEKPAKVMTSETVKRTEEVGFEAAAHQKANWGKGWSQYIYVAEDEDPPSAERQFAVLQEIVGAASGKGGKARFFLAVEDAIKRVEGTKDTKPASEPELNREQRAKRRTEGYEWLFGEAKPA